MALEPGDRDSLGSGDLGQVAIKVQRAALVVVLVVFLSLPYVGNAIGPLWGPKEEHQLKLQGVDRGPSPPSGRATAIAWGLLLTLTGASIMFAFRPGLAVALLAGRKAEDLWKLLRVLAPCLLFMVSGPSLMILNKHILQELHFDYPLSLSGLGLLASSVLAHGFVLTGLGTVRPESREVIAGWAWYRTALPIGLAKALTLAFGNAVYLYLGLGFIQMLKAFTPAIVVLVLKLSGMPPPSRVAARFLCLIVAGTMIEVRGELNVTLLGVVFMLSSEVMEAINLVLTQRLLQNCKFTLIEGLYVTAPPGAGCLFGMAAALEWPRMVQSGHQWIMLEHPLQFAAAALLGLLVNYLSLAVMQATSSLTLKILNTARCIGLVAVGVLFYGEACSAVEVFGYGIALCGFAGYNWAQMCPESSERVLERLERRCCERAVAKPGATAQSSQGSPASDQDPVPCCGGSKKVEAMPRKGGAPSSS